MKTILFLGVVALAVVALAVLASIWRAIGRTAAVPSLDDPKQVTPPPARDMNQNARVGEH